MFPTFFYNHWWSCFVIVEVGSLKYKKELRNVWAKRKKVVASSSSSILSPDHNVIPPPPPPCIASRRYKSRVIASRPAAAASTWAYRESELAFWLYCLDASTHTDTHTHGESVGEGETVIEARKHCVINQGVTRIRGTINAPLELCFVYTGWRLNLRNCGIIWISPSIHYYYYYFVISSGRTANSEVLNFIPSCLKLVLDCFESWKWEFHRKLHRVLLFWIWIDKCVNATRQESFSRTNSTRHFIRKKSGREKKRRRKGKTRKQPYSGRPRHLSNSSMHFSPFKVTSDNTKRRLTFFLRLIQIKINIGCIDHTYA